MEVKRVYMFLDLVWVVALDAFTPSVPAPLIGAAPPCERKFVVTQWLNDEPLVGANSAPIALDPAFVVVRGAPLISVSTPNGDLIVEGVGFLFYIRAPPTTVMTSVTLRHYFILPAKTVE